MKSFTTNTISQDGILYSIGDIPNIKHRDLIYKHSCRTIFNHYGVRNQKQQLIQELAELVMAITKNDLENIIEEMADVQVLLDQFRFNDYDLNTQIENIKYQKVKRQLLRISEEDN